MSFFCRTGIREMDQMYEKVTFYNFSNFVGGVALYTKRQFCDLSCPK